MMMNRRQKMLKLIRDKPYKIGHLLGFTDLTELHNDWIRKFILKKDDQTLLAHRGSYKTTCLSIALALMVIVRPKENIIFLRKTDTDVVEIIKQIAKMLEQPIMQEIAKELWDEDLILTTKSVSEINTTLNMSSRGVSQIIGMGIGTSITGKHGDIIVTDDIVNVKDRLSKADRDRTKSAYMELENVKNRSGRFINTGTPWHKEDAITTMPNVTRYDCYSTGLISMDELKQLRQKMTTSLFSANYELKHIADEEAMFTSPKYFKDDQKLYQGISHIDAAYGGDDRTAYTVASRIGNDFYVFGKLWARHVDDCLTQIQAYQGHFRAGTIYNELNGDKGYLNKELILRGMYGSPYFEKENKYIKIATKLRKNWVNVYFHEDTDHDYINEILDYTENAEHDDAPDSLASILRVLDNEDMDQDDNQTIEALNKLGLN